MGVSDVGALILCLLFILSNYLFVWYGYSSYFPPVTVSFVPSIFSFRNS